MTPKQISKYNKATLEECEEERLNNLKDYHDNELEANSFVIVDKLEENYVRIMNNDFTEVTEIANKFLAENDLTVASEYTPSKRSGSFNERWHIAIPKDCIRAGSI